jgi:hypothetical protein
VRVTSPHHIRCLVAWTGVELGQELRA